MLGIYFHWPFCRHRCPYCAFLKTTDSSLLRTYRRFYEARTEEILKEYNTLWRSNGPLSSIYFGGGTPSTMPPELLACLVSLCKKNFKTLPDVEITLEVNPNSQDPYLYKSWKSAGVTRLSLGLQSPNDTNLRRLGRTHSYRDAQKAYQYASSFFRNVSIDVIYGLPWQEPTHWTQELSRLLSDLRPQHVSAYALTIEPNTPYDYLRRRGSLHELPETKQLRFYHGTKETLAKHGLFPYEISNYATNTTMYGRHNVHTWNYGSVAGIGPGAHGRLRRGTTTLALENTRHIRGWIDNASSPQEICRHSPLSRETVFEEMTLLGLRTKTGLQEESLRGRTGYDFSRFSAEKLEQLRTRGWLCEEKRRLMPTDEGWLRLNAIVAYLLT